METDIREGGHILCLGAPEEILELNRRLEPHKICGSFLPFQNLMDLFDQYSVIVGGGHPFREGSHIPELPEEQLRRFDFLDLNGKDVAADREKSLETYGRTGRPAGDSDGQRKRHPSGSSVRLYPYQVFERNKYSEGIVPGDAGREL